MPFLILFANKRRGKNKRALSTAIKSAFCKSGELIFPTSSFSVTPNIPHKFPHRSRLGWLPTPISSHYQVASGDWPCRLPGLCQRWQYQAITSQYLRLLAICDFEMFGNGKEKDEQDKPGRLTIKPKILP